MDSVGAEVGQKMRSAIKAKLMELNCYVDDELPDYIMVMVANKRSKSQMNEDLQLFLTSKTEVFVDWLHIVLKKLKEVTVTNPEIYKKVSKRKIDDSASSLKVKKEKKSKKSKPIEANEPQKCLTDDLPLNVNKSSEQRKVVLVSETENSSSVVEDKFDIPPLCEVGGSNEKELQDIERKIRNVKSRLGLLVESDTNDDDDDCINIKAEPDELFADKNEERKATEIVKENSNGKRISSASTSPSKTPPRQNLLKKSIHERITFKAGENRSTSKRKSVLERLGKRKSSVEENETSSATKRFRNNLNDSGEEKGKSQRSASEKEKDRSRGRDRRSRSAEHRESKNEESRRRRDIFSRISNLELTEKKREKSVLSRLGVQSKVSVPYKEEEESFKTREVPSAIKVKPRNIPPDTPQANKNLLLKAVAEAQRSIAQTPTVGKDVKPDALFTRKYKEQLKDDKTSRKLSESQKNKIRKFIVQVPRRERYPSTSDDETEYVPKPIRKPTGLLNLNYTPSSKLESDLIKDMENSLSKQHFVVTLNGIERTTNCAKTGNSVKNRLESRKTPSPIIFNVAPAKVKTTKINVPDKLPVVQPSPSLKNKERCKYWPGCRQGDKCEFVHPTANCEMFPSCKFGDKCLYVHPSCKFSSSCTRRDCPYSHVIPTKAVTPRVASSLATAKIASQTSQTCKYFPNCTNINCSFYHPKPCKYGKYCKNQGECSFIHSFSHKKSSLTWRSK